MEKIIASRHFEVDEEIKSYVMGELTKLESEYGKLTSARLVLDSQKTWYYSEIVLRGKHLDIEAKGQAHDLRAAVDEVIAKTHAQLRKHLDRVHDHNKTPVSAIELANNNLATGEASA
jgi:ribosomal subunit interface protein